jgi:hypothetical protein
MTAILGTDLEKDYIQVGGIKFPLPKSPANGGEEYEIMRTTPLEPFQASSVLGDDSLIADDRIASAAFSDFRPGIGTRRYTEIESIGGVQDGDLRTLEGVLTVPFARESLGVLPAAMGNPQYGYGLSDNAQYRYLTWSVTVRPYVYDSTVPVWQTLTGPVAGQRLPPQGVARLGRYFVACFNTPAEIWYSLDGNTWTRGWTPGSGVFQGIAEHDGKTYVLYNDQTLNTLVFRWAATEAQLTAGVGVAWPGVSITYNYDGGRVFNIVNWTDDKTGDPMLYFSNAQKIVGYNDADFWSDFWFVPDYHSSYELYLVANPRDRLLYACHSRGNGVYVFNHQTVEEIGPNKDFGLPIGSNPGNFGVAGLAANTRNLFLFCQAQVANQQGRILVANDAFGWSPLVRGRRASNEDLNAVVSANQEIRGMFYAFGKLVYFVGNGVGANAIEYVYHPDAPYTPYHPIFSAVPPGRRREPGTWWAESAEFDAGHELLFKLLKYFRIHIERQATGAYSLMSSAGTEIRFKYAIDGGGWSAHTVLGPLDTWPKVIPLPSLANQSGLPFRKLRWAIGVNASNNVNNYETPIVRSVVVGMTREPDIYDGIQVVVDLSDERWDNGRLKSFGGLTRQALRREVEELKSGPGVTKTHYPVVLGWRGNTKTYASCDVRVSGVEDPNSRYGRFTLTLRDLTAPADG